jgi:hypothetical protein
LTVANERGHYGKNGVPHVGQDPRRAATIYVDRTPSSTGAWILGTIAIGGAVLFARHQSQQIEQLYKTSGLPYQSFSAGLRESVKSLPMRASASLHSLAERVRPKNSKKISMSAPSTPKTPKSEGA